MKIKVCVLGSNSEGAPEFSTTTISCSEKDYKNGGHYEKAIELAKDAGYDANSLLIAFDENDPAAHQLSEICAFFNSSTYTCKTKDAAMGTITELINKYDISFQDFIDEYNKLKS